MLLTKARIASYKSIDDSGQVEVDEDITVLVGQNESGKTAFLRALCKAESIDGSDKYEYIEDYPRRKLSEYESTHKANPAVVSELTYELFEGELQEINEDLGFELLDRLEFKVVHRYNNGRTIILNLPEANYVRHLIESSSLSSDEKSKVSDITTIEKLVGTLDGMDLNVESRSFIDDLKQRFADVDKHWNWLNYYVWSNHLQDNIPKFLYFDEYKILPGKVNLTTLSQRLATSKGNTSILSDEDRTVLGLLKLAKVELSDMLSPSGYEASKARLEGISNRITDKISEYWAQSQDIEVQFDIKEDPNDVAPFDNGNNLYIRIRSQRHRVSVPFNQRSKGFIWFFSFLVWFDSIQRQVDEGTPVILLLDEPGLNLHALAQADLLKYIDDLAKKYQVIYTTHSPFMVHGDKLHRVRMVEDKLKEGTKITANTSGSDHRTLFPLQAALGYTIAQNLFISKRNLLVEGPSDLIFLKFFSSILEAEGKEGLRSDVTVVPVGGLDKLATFIALLGSNQLEIAVLHDLSAKPDSRLESLVRDRVIAERKVVNFGMFRTIQSSQGQALQASDIEDIVSPALYLSLFNATFQKELSGVLIKDEELPQGDRIIDRISRHLKDNSIVIRPSGGFNHYRVANHLASNPLPASEIDRDTKDRFDKLFSQVNSLFSL